MVALAYTLGQLSGLREVTDNTPENPLRPRFLKPRTRPMSGCAEGRKILPGDADSFVAIVFFGMSLSTEPPKGQSSAAKHFVQETFRIGVPIRKVLSLFTPFRRYAQSRLA